MKNEFMETPHLFEASVDEPLPVFGSQAELRQIVRYLRDRGTNVSTTELSETTLFRRFFEPWKVATYLSWGFLLQDQGKFSLAKLGHELAKCLDGEATVFRTVIKGCRPYVTAVDWALSNNRTTVTTADVLDVWQENYPGCVPYSDEKSRENCALTFFNLCGMAGLGAVVVGRRAQPTRLLVDMSQLAEFVAVDFSVSKTEHRSTTPQREVPRNTESLKLMIFSEESGSIPAVLQNVLELTGYPFELQRRSEVFEVLGVNASKSLRSCTSAILIVDERNTVTLNGTCRLSSDVMVELGVARALYDMRVLFFWTGSCCPPELPNGISLAMCGDKASEWEVALEIGRVLKKFSARNEVSIAR